MTSLKPRDKGSFPLGNSEAVNILGEGNQQFIEISLVIYIGEKSMNHKTKNTHFCLFCCLGAGTTQNNSGRTPTTGH